MRPQADPITERFRAALTPALLEVDSPTLWFEAGRASARAERSARGWQAYSLVSTAAAAVLAFVIVQQNQTQPLADSAPPASSVVRTEPVVPPEPEPITEPITELITGPTTPNAPSWALWFVTARPDPDSYLGRRDLVLREGIDALPEPPRVEGVFNTSLPIEPPPTAARLLRMYLPAEKATTTKNEDPQADQSSRRPKEFV